MLRGILREHAVPIALALVLLALLGPRLADMHYVADDLPVVAEYTTVDAEGGVGPRWSRVAADFTGPWAGNPHIAFYRPAVSLSLALDFWLFGAAPGLQALVNLGLHLLSTFLVFALARRLLPDPRSAALAAALFACTPLAHESLAWAVGRCALCVAPSLAAGLVFLRRYERGLRGWGLQAPVLGLLTLAMLSMESALSWALFPGLCLALSGLFLRQEVEERGLAFLRLIAPQCLLALAFFALRTALLGPPDPAHLDLVLPTRPVDWPLAALDRLVESLVPIDESAFDGRVGLQGFWRMLCLVPLLLGLFAPLHFRDPRSARYRRALLLLLGFFVLTRLPTLGFGLRANLDSARTAYYAWPTLCLLSALLLATNRYSRWLGFVVALGFLVQLQHRIEERRVQAGLGDEARAILVQEQERRVAEPGARALCYVNRIQGTWGAPAIQPGEMAYALLPQLSPPLLPSFSLHGLSTRQEWAAISAFGKALGGVVLVREPSRGGSMPVIEALPLDGVPMVRPEALALRPRLVRGTGGWELSVDGRIEPGTIPADLVATLILVAGPDDFVLPVPDPSLPEAAGRALDVWLRRAGDQAWTAMLLEYRRRGGAPGSAAEALFRSEVVVQKLAR